MQFSSLFFWRKILKIYFQGSKFKICNLFSNSKFYIYIMFVSLPFALKGLEWHEKRPLENILKMRFETLYIFFEEEQGRKNSQGV